MPRSHAADAPTHKPRANTSMCWARGASDCADDEQCYVKFKTSKGGFAQCHKLCPPGWLCETRQAGGHCGGAPLPQKLEPAPTEATALLFERVGAPSAGLCNRAAPPPSKHHSLNAQLKLRTTCRGSPIAHVLPGI